MDDLLFLAQRLPIPPTKGDKLRSFHWLRGLARHFRIHLGCFVDDPDDWRHAGGLGEWVASSCVLPLSPAWATLRALPALLTGQPLGLRYCRDRSMGQWVRSVLHEVRPRAALVFSSPMATYLPARLRPPLMVMDFCDVDSQKWAQYAERRPWPLSALYRREARRLLEFERQVACEADSSLFVSAAERDLFRTLAPAAAGRSHVVENGIDCAWYTPEPRPPSPYGAGGPVAAFTGAMDYWPNVEAVRWFAADILPLLRRTVPHLRFAVVGSNPARPVQALKRLPGVTVTGRVPDIRPWLANASVVVAPLLTARGVQNKVLEGMAMARPVVATPQAFEGIDATPGRHLLVAEGAQAFARATLDALTAAEMGAEARRHVAAVYDWERRFARLYRLLEVS